MTDRFQTLMAEAAAEDKAELTLAYNAKISAMKAYKDKPGKQTKDDLDATRAMFDETVDRLTRRYLPDQVPAPEGERFANRKQAHDWLQAQGYKISRGKFYQDCDAGRPMVHKDGTLSRFQVLQYGQQLDVDRRSTGGNGDLYQQKEEAEQRKAKADADKAEMQAEEMRREQDKKWLHADDAWAAVAGIIGTLLDSLRHQFHVGQAHLVHLAAGDPARGPEVYEGAEELIARAFNEVCSSGRIEAVFVNDALEEDMV